MFLFLDLSTYAGSKATLLTRRWDAVLGDNTSTSFTDTGTLLGRQKVVPVTSWDATSKQIEAWTVFCKVFLRGIIRPPSHSRTQRPRQKY